MEFNPKLKLIISIFLWTLSLSVTSAFSNYNPVTDAGKKVEKFAFAIEDFLSGHGASAQFETEHHNNCSLSLTDSTTDLLKYRIENLSRSAKVIDLYRGEVLKSFISYREIIAINSTNKKILSLIKVLAEIDSPYSIAAIDHVIDRVKKISGYQELAYTDSIVSLIITPRDKQAINELNDIINNFHRYIVNDFECGLGLNISKRKAFFEYVEQNSDALALNEYNLAIQYDILHLLNTKFLNDNSYDKLLKLQKKGYLNLETESLANGELLAYKICNDIKFESVINNQCSTEFQTLFDKLSKTRTRIFKLLQLIPVF